MKWRRLADYLVVSVMVVAIIFAIKYFGLSEFSGYALAVDGDSLIIDGKQIRLYGIDAPELKQKCQLADGISYNCGLQARDQLRRLVRNAQVTCTRIDVDKYQRDVSECVAGETNLNKAMVASGWAVAFALHTPAYLALENQARRRGLGLWRGKFVKPRIWRQMNPR